MLTVLESFLGVTTNMTFLAYTDRNHPLLKRLQMEAPGTYHHCERVASIAEKAATVIGCNPWKVQACALFHDIGKLSDPGKFTENSGGTNCFDNLSPEESAAIIRKHVSYGLELARKYKLKPSLRTSIACHHGTDFISFFYQLAKKDHPETVSESDFRYEGPLPQNKENTILMLADCCEAALRSSAMPTPEEVYQKVDEIFQHKYLHGQLNDSILTFEELNQIKESFVNTLITMNHVRIAYPKQ